VREQLTIFHYLERKLKQDERVKNHPPRQSYQRIFTEVLKLRNIALWELQQLVQGILTDETITNPIAALRSPDTFSTEYYLHLAEHTPQVTCEEQPPSAGPGFRAGECRQQTLWDQVLRLLEKRLTRSSYTTWLKPLQGHFHGQTLVLNVPNDTFVYWLREQYEGLIGETIEHLTGVQPHFEYMIHGPPSADRTEKGR
jgi:hypothetical protein